MPTVDVRRGDCRDVLRELGDASVDAVVCDPPYELGFMGRSWDASGIAYDAGLWREVLRVLKPGGHLLAFGGSRTYHRMACAIEDAGFDVRDCMMWVYGSGFPKSLDVSKAIDKAAGAEREVVSTKPAYGIGGNGCFGGHSDGAVASITLPATDDARQWQGWGTALKPAHEPIVVARKPLQGTVAANVLTHGTGAINVDGCRTGTTVETWPASRSYAPGQMQPGHVGKTIATGPAPAGRWPANVILSHDPACSEDCAPGCPCAAMDAQSDGASRFFKQLPINADDLVPFFYGAKASRSEREAGCEGLPSRIPPAVECQVDFDKSGLQSPRAGTGRTAGAVRNSHPTVKPIAVMRHLVRLVTPPGGLVLDPFTGSGTTGIACVREGVSFLGIEREEEYHAIATARTAHARPDVQAPAVGQLRLLDDQPEPIPAEGDVWMECVADAPPHLVPLYLERRAQGVRRYGTSLQRGNGRDHMADGIQELADAVVYFRAAGRADLSAQVQSILVDSLADALRS